MKVSVFFCSYLPRYLPRARLVKILGAGNKVNATTTPADEEGGSWSMTLAKKLTSEKKNGKAGGNLHSKFMSTTAVSKSKGVSALDH